jgi:hypothetical protein
VAPGLRNISARLRAHAPRALEALESMRLDRDEEAALLSWVSLMSIPEVQTVGFEVTLAIRRSLTLNESSDTLADRIQDMLLSNAVKVHELWGDYVTPAMIGIWNGSRQWQMTLQTENLKVMQAFSKTGQLYGSMSASFYAQNSSRLPEKVPAEEKAYGAWGGVLEQARVLLGAVQLASQARGTELLIPAQATNLGNNVDVEDLGSELLSCELQSKDGMNNFMKAIFCPLKYGIQGVEALRAVHRWQHPDG